MKIGIVEDESLSAQRLISMLHDFDPELNIAFVAESNRQLQALLTEQAHPDLLFCDIELIDGPVFSTFEQVSPDCPIVFTTAYDDFYMQAFSENGIAYLLKPFAQEQLAQAMNKYKKLVSRPLERSVLARLSQSQQTESKRVKKRFAIKRHNGIELLSVADISCIRLGLSGLCAWDDSNKSYPLSETSLTQVAAQLPADEFFQINRNDLISIKAINKVVQEDKDRLAIWLKGADQALIVSAKRTPDFRNWLSG